MTPLDAVVHTTNLPGLLVRGKVRDVYDLGDRLMIVATDRVSAFDVVMSEPVPGKGVVLTQMSRFWLESLPACTPHHLDYVVTEERQPRGYEPFIDQLRGRAMVVRKALMLPIECVARGFIIGGGWKEYQARGAVSGVRLPAGLKLAQRLPEPIFTPSTKAASGHDDPIDFEQACTAAEMFAVQQGWSAVFGRELMHAARKRTLDIYSQAVRLAEQRGILIADTKLEFGVCGGRLILADEVLTPDSSRFWPMDSYRVGQNPPSYDKQFLRDYLESTNWPKKAPPPPIPAEIIARTRARFEEVCRLLIGGVQSAL